MYNAKSDTTGCHTRRNLADILRYVHLPRHRPPGNSKEILGKHAGDAKWFTRKSIQHPRRDKVNVGLLVKANEPWTQEGAVVPCTQDEIIADLQDFDHRLRKVLA